VIVSADWKLNRLRASIRAIGTLVKLLQRYSYTETAALIVPARSRLTSLRVMEWSGRNLSKPSSRQGIGLVRSARASRARWSVLTAQLHSGLRMAVAGASGGQIWPPGLSANGG